MSYGLNHPRGGPMPRRMDRRPAVRTPSVVLGWAVREFASMVVAGFVAVAVLAIVGGLLLAIASACGALRGQTSSTFWTGIIASTSVAGLVQVFRGVRERTRPSPLPPPFEFASGRSSPLWDRELDG